MKVGDLVEIHSNYSSLENGTLGIVVSKKVYFGSQVSFSIMWCDGDIVDGWLNENSFIKVIS